MKDLLRSLLIPDKPPPRRRPPSKPAPKPAPSPASPSAVAVDERSTGALVRDMIRRKLDDPEYAKRFAAGIKALLRGDR